MNGIRRVSIWAVIACALVLGSPAVEAKGFYFGASLGQGEAKDLGLRQIADGSVLTGGVDGTDSGCPTDVVIDSCTDNDGCCAPGCNNGNDNDCAAVCSNNVREAAEECDGTDDSACPGQCASNCTCPLTGGIPTASFWGLSVLALLLLAGAKVYFGRQTVLDA